MEFYASVFVIAFFAGASQGLTGFGFSLILVPLLSLIYDPKAAVMVSLTLGLVSKVLLLIQDWRHVQWRLLAPLVLAALVGNAAGTRVILYADSTVLHLVIGITVVVIAALLLFDFRVKLRREKVATVLVGLVSGALIGSTSMGGPPVVLFGINQAWAKQSLRANMIAYFTITFVFTSALLAFSGALTRDIMLTDAVMLPSMVVGLYAGNLAFHRAPRDLLYRVAILFVIATGIVGVYTSATSLWPG